MSRLKFQERSRRQQLTAGMNGRKLGQVKDQVVDNDPQISVGIVASDLGLGEFLVRNVGNLRHCFGKGSKQKGLKGD